MEDVLRSLLALLALDRLPRTGWIQAGVAAPETIAGHTLGTALVVLALGPAVEPPLDLDRAVALAVLHDVPEALLGDVPRAGARHLPAGAKRAAEEAAADELLGPFPAAAADRFAELHAGETREARFVRVCDKLQLGVRLLGYRRSGQRGLEAFRSTLLELDCDGFAPCEALLAALRGALEAPREASPDVS